MKNINIEIKWGIIFTIVGLLWMVMEKALGWHSEHIDKHPIYTMGWGVVAVLLVMMALQEKRNKDYGGKMTWKEGFVAGLIMSLIIAVLTIPSQLITHQLISPEYFPNAINYAVESGKMEQATAEKFFNLKSYLIQSAIGALGMGVVTSAIVALIVKRN